MPFTSDSRNCIPKLDFGFLDKDKKKPRRLYKVIEAKREEQRELAHDDSSYTASLEDEIAQSDVLRDMSENGSYLSFSPTRKQGMGLLDPKM